MEAASKLVEDAAIKETVALEKLKAARVQKLEANAAKTSLDRGEAQKAVIVLELELEARQKKQELEDAKKAAQEAQEAAKKA
eukprot:CAMPEP_0179230122 /NCGR_PEP_ID=MMETSP0797-20121207/10678_1 /TAXON_ID=47934 /ORGANISM="Dinophysis acuminata, Strain DAEP01" /LENGTH=81 /DNA_ID=CAMNT_0020937195 /DNA_START=12 /DNA_END=253 /DNA_ORIENTATION=+